MNRMNVVFFEWYDAVLTSASTANRTVSLFWVLVVVASPETTVLTSRSSGDGSTAPLVHPPAENASGARHRAVVSP